MSAPMRLRELTDVSAAVAATRSRKAKTEAIGALLAGAAPDEVAAAVAFLSGRLTQRQIGVGWAQLREPPPPADEPSLTVGEVDAAFEAIGAISGPGSQATRRDALQALLGRADEDEQQFLTRLLIGDLGQGALAGVMTAAVAHAAEVPEADVRRALTLHGDLPEIARIALREGRDGLAAVHLKVGRPLSPMLAATAPDVAAALEKTGRAAVEHKLDGARVQIHRDGDTVAVFTRSLDDVTAHVPEAVEAVLALPATSVVLDGEVIALREDGRPHPFQVTGSRFGSRRDLEKLRREIPLSVFFFDLLHLDGRDLLDAPLAERAAALDRLAPQLRIPHAVAEDVQAAQAVFDDALARGHEGVMVKDLEAPYAAGRRGAAWLKVKPVHTLDLVVLAAEWGHGRRRGFLSNLHLGARDGDGFAMLGKTFKGLTDELLAWQTKRFQELETHRDGHTVYVRPEQVVEIAFDGIQTSRRYPAGMALRFARVKRYRDDKTAAEADTVETVRAIAG
ncbi:MAG TPA: ATP-dependent DNA ligase [Solirubrobacteraceae bacterium]|nr:ATP-dependent DNA ligase [Solirubrobacteraceae bacterium]